MWVRLAALIHTRPCPRRYAISQDLRLFTPSHTFSHLLTPSRSSTRAHALAAAERTAVQVRQLHPGAFPANADANRAGSGRSGRAAAGTKEADEEHDQPLRRFSRWLGGEEEDSLPKQLIRRMSNNEQQHA